MSGKRNLKELVDLDELQSIQDMFAKTVGTSSVIFSADGVPLTQFSNSTGFCSLIQSTEEGKRRCLQSFMEMSRKALELKEPKIFYCFAHGGHFVAPIIIDGEHKGTMFGGQFIPEKFSDEQIIEISRIAEEINIKPELLVKEAKKMRVVEEEKVSNYSGLLFQIVGVIARLGAQSDELNRANDALQKAHNGLEIRVQERTAELARANEELEQEITERKCAEEERHKSEVRFRELFDNMSSGVAVYEAKEGGKDFVFTDFNKAAETLDKTKKKDLIGKSVLEVFPGVRDFGLFDVFQRVWNTGKPEHLPISLYKDERIAGWRENFVYKLPSGEIVAVYDDVTERKRAEEELQESEEKYRTFIEKTSEGYWGLNSEHKTSDVNPALCAMLGYKKEEMIGRSPHDFVDEENLKIFKYQMGKIESTQHRSYEIVLKKKSGEDVFTRFNATTIIDDSGEFKGAYSLVTDITEQKKAEEEREVLIHDLAETNKRLEQQARELEEARAAALNIAYDLDDARRAAEESKNELEKMTQKLDKSNKDLRDFAYIVSHDLKAPVRKVAMFGELLTESLAGKLDEDEQENFDFMIEGATRMQELIDALLTYSRVQTRAKPMEQVDLNEVVEDMKEVELALQLEEAGGVIEVPEPLPIVHADPSQMHQLLQNLIGNGLKYQQEGVPPVVTVRGKEDGNMVRIEVQDNGIGIEEEHYEKVFGMFQRLHTDDKGTGVGLAVCKRIVERHGGEIGVVSKPGEGSRFWFTVPGGER